LNILKPARISGVFVPAAFVLGLTMVAAPVLAQDVNCANEFRSGKLYFSQGLFEKSMNRFATAVEVCPEKGEYHARYALALSEMGREYIGKVAFSTEDERDTLLTKGIEFFRKAGEEFQAALDTEEGKKKKLQNFVEENRGHYWVDAYNEGIDLVAEEHFEDASIQFDVARLLNPGDVRAYSQGAIARLQADHREEALELVQKGLEIDPEDENLNTLEISIYKEAALDYASKGESEEDAEKIMESLALYALLIERDSTNANLYFDRALTALSGSRVVARTDSAAGVGLCASSAADFLRAAEMVPPEGDIDFHVNSLFNAVQAYSCAGNYGGAMSVLEEYLCKQPTDPAAWQFMAGLLVEGDDQDAVVSALMVSKSLAGEEVSVETNAANATKDAKEDLNAHGPPEGVYTYQEASSGNQIHTWFWLEKHMAKSYILGERNGEVSWCRE
jgi:tetratricopeptide (TPR) repeat protein